MGTAATSSDEEGLTDSENPGPEGHSKVYFVKRRAYLSAAVTELNEEVDEQSEILARKTFMRGSMPRRRIRTEEVSTRKPVLYLAVNAYDEDWMEDLEEFDRDRLEPNMEPHPF